MNEELEAAVNDLERALCARYNVDTLPEHLGAAVADARAGNLGSITGLMAGREMYRWQADADSALAAAHAAVEPIPPEGKPIARMNKGELLELAAERGITADAGQTVAQLRDLLSQAVADGPDEENEDGVDESEDEGEEPPDEESDDGE